MVRNSRPIFIKLHANCSVFENEKKKIIQGFKALEFR